LVLFKKDPEIRWAKASKNIKLSVKNVRDPNSQRVAHDYTVSLNIGEVRQIIEALAEKGIVNCQGEISQEFRTQLDKLLKIMMCSVGIVA
jgi:predicted transcriptional regulator YheO